MSCDDSNSCYVAIVDYAMSNLHSVQAACTYSGLNSIVTSDLNVIERASGIVLPGVGAMAEAIARITSLGLDSAIMKCVQQDKPFLGICLGMQLLFGESEEFGFTKGLGIVDGVVRKLAYEGCDSRRCPVPQIGWNTIDQASTAWKATLLEDNVSGDHMYFVHSYYVIPKNDNIVVSFTKYGSTKFASAIKIDNLFACQFHPEKSGPTGLKVYENFSREVKRRG